MGFKTKASWQCVKASQVTRPVLVRLDLVLEKALSFSRLTLAIRHQLEPVESAWEVWGVGWRTVFVVDRKHRDFGDWVRDVKGSS